VKAFLKLTYLTGLTVLFFSILAVSTAKAAENSYPVKCQFFQRGEDGRPPARDGHLLIQKVGQVTSLRLRSGPEELSLTTRSFVRGLQGRDPIIWSLQVNNNFKRKVVFLKNAVAIQHFDSEGVSQAVMACQGQDMPAVADWLIGTEAGDPGLMETAMEKYSQPGNASTAAGSPVAPSAPAAPSAPVVNGLPPGLAENLGYLQGQN
jgi:hypothetical protein